MHHPHICDHLETRVRGTEGADGTGAAEGDHRPIALCPIGFVSDHMKVMWGIDNEAADTASELGVTMVQAATPGPTLEFTEMILDLVCEHWSVLPA